MCRRYLTRQRRHRLAGGTFGIVLVSVIGIRWFGSVTIGLGQGSPLADLLFCGIGGVIIGTLSAETYRLTTTPGAQRTASLTPRPSSVGRGRLEVSRAFAVAALVVDVAAVLTDRGTLPLVTSMVFVVPLVVAELVMGVIASRSRPAMTDRATHLDEQLRIFAGSSLSYLHLATALLMFCWTVSKVDELEEHLAVLRNFAVIGCLVASVVMLRRAAPRPSDHIAFGDGVPAA